MTNRNTILNELSDIDSTLGNLNPQNLYTVPNGYFEGLPTQIMNRIKALETTNAKEELEYLSPLLSNVSKEMPYTVPVGFFQNFGDDVMQRISENVNHLPQVRKVRKDSFGESFGQTSEEEIEALSPLLSGLKNKNPYSVPAGYFDTLETTVQKREAKVISITKRRWYRMAIAAAVIGIVAITGLLMINRNKITNEDPQTLVSKLFKEVGDEKVNEFVTLVTPDESQKTAEENDAATQAEVKELMKDVSEKEIDEFLNDAIALESNDNTDALMN
jgi:hypothetical protein